METLSHFMEGKKTYAGIIISVIGVLGVSHFVTPDEVSATYDSIIQLAGLALAVYGRYKANK
jgi:hypothetical protein